MFVFWNVVLSIWYWNYKIFRKYKENPKKDIHYSLMFWQVKMLLFMDYWNFEFSLTRVHKKDLIRMLFDSDFNIKSNAKVKHKLCPQNAKNSTHIWKIHSEDKTSCVCVCLVPESFDSLWPPWTAAFQAPLSMGFPRQEYWSGLLVPSPGDLPNPGIKTHVLCLTLILYHWATWEPHRRLCHNIINQWFIKSLRMEVFLSNNIAGKK